MRRFETTLLYLSGIIVDFSWLYAWASFSVLSLGYLPLPLVRSIALFICGMAVIRIVHGRGLRIITVGFVQLLGICAALLSTLHFMSGSHRTIIDLAWLPEFFMISHTATEWLYIILTTFWTIAIWFSGFFFALRPATHEKVCSRFDIGLAAFLCLLLIRSVADIRGVVMGNGYFTIISACIFFFFGLLAIGITRAHSPEATSLIYGRRKIGIIFGFISAVFLSAVSLIVFLRQPLSLAAGVGYNALVKTGSSARALFVQLIRFLYSPRQISIKEPPSGGNGGAFDHIASSGSPPWMATAIKALSWLIGTFAGILVIIVIIIGAVWITRILLARTKKDGRPTGRTFNIPAVLKRIKALFAEMLRSFRPRRTAADFYRALKAWSALSGIRPVACETPSEFSRRIKKSFPAINLEIDFITHAFNREFYGNIPLGGDEIRSVRSCWRKISSPRLWPERLKTLVGRV